MIRPKLLAAKSEEPTADTIGIAVENKRPGSGMAILNAVGSSLLSVGTFGAATAANYAVSGLVDWPVAGLFILGGVGGGALGMRLAVRLASRKGILTRIFAGVVFATAAYMLYQSAGTLLVSGKRNAL